MKQKASAEDKFSGKVSRQLNTILVGAKVSSGAVQSIPTPDLDIRFSCNDYYIGSASQRLGNRVVFAPEFLEGDEIITWALDWNVPFKVSTFLYMTSPYVKYIVVGDVSDMSDAESLYNKLPGKLNKELISIVDFDNILDDNDKHVRFIFVNVVVPSKPPSDFEEYSKLSALKVTLSSSDVNKAQFYQVNPDMTFSPQSGDEFQCIEWELLYGAIFSDNYDIYKCLTKRAYQRLNVVAQVYEKRLEILAPEYSYTQCEGMYTTNNKVTDFIDATSNSASIQYDTLVIAKGALRMDNDRLQLFSCALVY